MANGDITKQFENDRIEIVGSWNIQIRKATKIMEEQADGSKIELNRQFERKSLQPFQCEKHDGKITYTATDISGEDADVQSVCNAVWTDTVKNNFKTWAEDNFFALR
tara:strand:- start:49 stop:369 length:321 start_codon:yes stop_codon:yes gene_type:complete